MQNNLLPILKVNHLQTGSNLSHFICITSSNVEVIKRSVSLPSRPPIFEKSYGLRKKPIVRFFPHEIADLSIALDYMRLPNGLVHESSQWALRYVILLWLYLICMIPFDLVQFDETENMGATAAAIESIAMTYLGRAGLEREAAVLLLSRLYTRYVYILLLLYFWSKNVSRKDAGERFHKFIEWSHSLLREGHDVFTVSIL